ncbi:MAG: hypothetical protein Q9162_000515 [Coniocarpon cinnabarinum]
MYKKTLLINAAVLLAPFLASALPATTSLQARADEPTVDFTSYDLDLDQGKVCANGAIIPSPDGFTASRITGITDQHVNMPAANWIYLKASANNIVVGLFASPDCKGGYKPVNMHDFTVEGSGDYTTCIDARSIRGAPEAGNFQCVKLLATCDDVGHCTYVAPT